MFAKNITHSATWAFPAVRDYTGLQTEEERREGRRGGRREGGEEGRMKGGREESKSHLSASALWLSSPG